MLSQFSSQHTQPISLISHSFSYFCVGISVSSRTDPPTPALPPTHILTPTLFYKVISFFPWLLCHSKEQGVWRKEDRLEIDSWFCHFIGMSTWDFANIKWRCGTVRSTSSFPAQNAASDFMWGPKNELQQNRICWELERPHLAASSPPSTDQQLEFTKRNPSRNFQRL